MQAASSAEPVFDVPARMRTAMVLIGFVPFLHVAATLAPIAFTVMGGPRWSLALAPVALYLLPPLLVRLVTWRRPLPSGLVELESAAFLHWWFTAQCQVVFLRLPWLEESLRLVPGLYSAWLGLWGATIGSLVYWSPGVVILDRHLLQVGDRVAFGSGARLNPHVITPLPGRRPALVLAPVTIGSDALIGGYSTLLPGCVVAPGEATHSFRSVHAFTRVEGGRRSRLPTMPSFVDVDALAD